MPARKIRLSKNDIAIYRASAQQLLDAGLISEIPREWMPSSCPVQVQVAPPPDSVVCDLADGKVCYALLVRILSKSGITLQDCQIITPWDSQVILAKFDDEGQNVD